MSNNTSHKVTMYKKINNEVTPIYPKTTADMVITNDSGNTIADVLSDGTIIKYCSNATYASNTKTISCTVDGITLRTGATFLLKLPVDLSEDNLKLNVNNLGAKYIHIGGYGAKQNGVCMFIYDATLESNAGAWVLISGVASDVATLDSNGKILTSQLPNSISGASIEWHTFS